MYEEALTRRRETGTLKESEESTTTWSRATLEMDIHLDWDFLIVSRNNTYFSFVLIFMGAVGIEEQRGSKVATEL
jgi:hypothetical protein